MVAAQLRKFSLRCFILFGISVGAPTSASAQIGNGLGTGKYGTFNTYSAFAMEQGFLSMSNQGRLYVVAGQSGYSAVKNVNLTHASNNFTFSYGFLENFDALISIGTYQDLNIRAVRGKQATTPGDINITIRGASFEAFDGKVGLGASLSSRIPTGGQNNIPFEVYKSRKPEFGILGLASVYGNPYYKDQSYIINFNLGLWFHNDNGTNVSPVKSNADSLQSNVNSMALQYGFGILFPISKIQLTLDAYGLAYLTQPIKYVYSRESFMYITPGLRYNLRSWINIGTYVDILVSGKADKTKYYVNTPTEHSGNPSILKPGETSTSKGAPNYNSWRFGFNLGFNILPMGFSSAPTEQRRKKLLDRLVEEEKGAQKASNQLEKLKTVRLDAEKELEKIKLELEGDGGQ